MGVLRNRQEKPTLCDVINEGDSHFGNNVIHHMFLMHATIMGWRDRKGKCLSQSTLYIWYTIHSCIQNGGAANM